MPESLTILQNDPTFNPELSFEQLRNRGLEHIADLSGDVWSDHNLHDPGITILEVLCYAVADLAYRNQLPLEDLLAKSLEPRQAEDNFFTPEQILTCNPLTIFDYRKMLMDIDGVKNAWLEIADKAEVDLYVNCADNHLQFQAEDGQALMLNGLYKVYLELEHTHPAQVNQQNCEDGEANFSQIIQEVQNKLHSHRNLCEDFLDVVVLQDEQIGICGEIELDSNADPDETLLNIFNKIQAFLSPNLKFYSLQEMLKKGKSIEEIFAGRPLSPHSHGFIDPADLEQQKRRTELHTSDLYRVIMQAEGVRAIKDLNLVNYFDGVPQTNGEPWCLKLTDLHRPVLSPELSIINFFKGVLPFRARKTKAVETFQKRLANFQKVKLPFYQLDLEVPQGRHRKDLGEYRSILHEFPLNYAVGHRELPASATTLRKAQVKQLRGYLLFFDQLLSNYLFQLSHVRDLFSLSPDTKRSEENQRTYFAQRLEDLPGAEELLRFYDPQNSSAKQEDDFQYKEVVADFWNGENEQTFSNPETRDNSLTYTIQVFKNQEFVVETSEESCGFCFIIKDQFDQTLLKSRHLFESDFKAKQIANRLSFVASEAQAYKKINRQKQGNYSFQLCYHPIDYWTYLKQITENQATYHQRRDTFLNHLLARFGEHFTDYVLLMFALDGKRKDSADILEDKANFLMQYPDISRNRGRAFDYTQTDELWNTKNLSGLEKRVPALMGIQDWKRQNLSNIQIVKRKDIYHFELLDYKGCVILIGENAYPSQEDAEAAFEDFINQLIDNPSDLCKNIDCSTDSVYGFAVFDTQDCIVARHPFTYCNAAERDEAKNCILSFLRHQGLIVEINHKVEGYFFEWLDDEGQIIFISFKSAATEAEAQRAFLDFMDSAPNILNWEIINNTSRTGKSFVIKHKNTQEILATHPHSYPDDQVDAKMEAVFNCFQALYLAPTYSQNPPTYRWQLLDKEATLVLESFAQFGSDNQVEQEQSAIFHSPQQSTQAFLYFLEHFNLEMPFVDATDEWAFYIQSPLGVLARSVIFDSEIEREEAKEQMPAQLSVLKAYFENSIFSYEEACYLELLDTHQNTLLTSHSIYRDLAFIAQDEQELKTFLRKKNSLIIQEDNGTLAYYLELKNDKNQVIASSEKSSQKSEIEALYQQIQHLVAQEQFHFSPARIQQKLYSFLLLDAEENPLLESIQLFKTKAAAFEAWLAIYPFTKVEANFETTEDYRPSFSFLLKNKEQDIVLATYPYAFRSLEDRNRFLDKSIQFFSTHTPLLNIQQKAGSFYFFLEDEEGLLLKSCQNYESEAAVKQAWWEFLELGCQADYFKKISDDEGCRDSFIFITAEQKWAAHPYFYPRTAEGIVNLELRMEDAKNLTCQHRFPYRIRPEKRKWHLTLKMLDCGFHCVPILVSIDYNTLEELKENQENWLLAIHSEEGKLQLDNDNASIYLEVNGEIIACSPESYEDAKSQKQKVEAYLLAYRNISNFTPHIKHAFDVREVKKEDREKHIKLEEAYGFRLIKEEGTIAEHPTIYPTADERDKQLERFLKGKKRFKNKYSRVLTSGNLTIKIAEEEQVQEFCAEAVGKYRFLIINETNREVLWESATTFANQEAAMTAFHQQYISIIQLAKEVSYYEKHEEPNAVFLLDKKGNTVAQIPTDSFDNQSLEEAIATRRNHALMFPINLENKRYSFQFYNKNTRQNIWQSKKSFAHIEEAWEAFECFLDLLLYAPNWYKTGCRATGYGFVLKNISLESQLLYSTSDEAWQATKEALQDSQQAYGLYPYVDYDDNCRYGFRSVAPSYRLAQHPHLFYTHEEREVTLNWLLDYAKCQGFRCLSVSGKAIPIGNLCHFQIMIPNPEGEGKIVLWQSRTTYENQTAALRAYEENYIHILQLAKDPAYYHFIPDRVGGCTIALQNETGHIVATLPQTFAVDMPEIREKAVLHQIEQARHFPIKPTSKGFEFELYALEFDRKALQEKAAQLIQTIPCVDDNEETIEETIEEVLPPFPNDCGPKDESYLMDYIQQLIPGEVVWKSVHTYTKVWDAFCSVELLKDGVDNPAHVTEDTRPVGLLQQPLSYQRVAEHDHCGPFQLEVVNPKCIRAEHPRTYVLSAERNEAMEQTLTCMNVEGFHLLEHILLRPLEAVETAYFIQVVVVKKYKSESGYQKSEKQNYVLTHESYDSLQKAQAALQEKHNTLKDAQISHLNRIKILPLVLEKLGSFENIPEEDWLSTLNLSNEEETLINYQITLQLYNHGKAVADCDLMSICVEDNCCSSATLEESLSSKLVLCGLEEEEKTEEDMLFDNYIPGADPYSFWLTVVLPYWPNRFLNPNFRMFFEDTLRREIPAHAALRILWVNPQQMQLFEKSYKNWLETLSGAANCNRIEAQRNLLKVLAALRNEYLPATLHDCEEDNSGGNVFLNQTQLG